MSEFSYDPTIVEAKWRKKWQEAGTYNTDLKKAKKPFYNLVMFPYPSGDKLHVGHWYNYAPADSFGRYMRMKGHDVFEPMGFDAFGLPAENYAIKTGVPPHVSIKQNVENMIEQLSRLGCMYDWDTMVCTTDPEYYRWTQWLFLQMLTHDIAERRLANVNWCPKDQTVLAREQCQDGKCERCGTEVIQKPLTQWFWKITKYADKLVDNLDRLDWPEKTKTMQRHWIGKSVGAEIHFDIADHNEKITVFTTRADTIFGVTYVVLAPEHPLVEKITPKSHWGAVEAYRAEVSKKTELQRTDLNKDKNGIPTGAFALHPVTGEKLPIWVADYVLASYGTGAVMAVPAHDDRDFAFATKFSLPMKMVVQPIKAVYTVIEKSMAPESIEKLKDHGDVAVLKTDKDWGKFFLVTVEAKSEMDFVAFLKKHLRETSEDGGSWYADSAGSTNIVVFFGEGFRIDMPEGMAAFKEHGRKVGVPEEQLGIAVKAYGDDGIAINSDFLDGLTTEEATKKAIAWLEDEEKGRGVIQFRLKDWLVSRQRYWGAPIPVVYDPEGKAHPIPEKHLPWLLPTDVEFKPTGESPLRQSVEFRERTEKLFGKGWTPEYDTMDTFVCSSFYYLRYLAGSEERVARSAKAAASNDPLTATRLLDPEIERRWMPVDMYIGGAEHACMHLIYARFVMMALKDFGFVSHEEPFQRLIHQGLITKDGAKMSKSKGNVVSPDEFVERHGADVFRMYLMFMGPFTDGGDWSDTGIKGVDRFVQRSWKILSAIPLETKDDPSLGVAVHSTVKRVTESLEKLQFNTAIAALMEFLNTIEASSGASRGTAKVFARLIAPLAPHLAEELWETLHRDDERGKNGETGFVIYEEWPSFDSAMLVSDTMTLAVQVNGKLRGDLTVASGASKDDIVAAAKEVENVKKFLDGQTVKKEIYVPGKLVSFVV